MSFLKDNNKKKCHDDNKTDLIVISKLFLGLKTAKFAVESLNFLIFYNLCNNFRLLCPRASNLTTVISIFNIMFTVKTLGKR